MNFIDNKLKAKIDSLTISERDEVYRYLWKKHVKENVRNYASNRYAGLTESEIETIAEWYVYDGDYDCELSYWDNIDNLIMRLCLERRK